MDRANPRPKAIRTRKILVPTQIEYITLPLYTCQGFGGKAEVSKFQCSLLFNSLSSSSRNFTSQRLLNTFTHQRRSSLHLKFQVERAGNRIQTKWDLEPLFSRWSCRISMFLRGMHSTFVRKGKACFLSHINQQHLDLLYMSPISCICEKSRFFWGSLMPNP